MLLRSGVTHLNHISRYREIANVFIKNGFGFLFDKFSLRKIMGFRKPAGWESDNENYGNPQRLRYALVELGPTFVKLGQLLSIRPDLLGSDYIKELEKLQNQVPPITYDEVVFVCQQAGIDIERDFQWINPVPLAAASIAQVHEAVLHSGEKVVLKVQRPGIAKVVETDLLILADMGRLLEKHTAWGSLYRLSEIVDEFASAIRKELDFVQEAHNADVFRSQYQDNPNVLIPKVYWEFSSSKVLTMECLLGIKVSDFAGINKGELSTSNVAEHLLEALFSQIYEYGFFHADPHPGNIAINAAGQIIFYDFGQVGVLDEILKEYCIDLLLSMMRYDVNGVTRALLSIGISNKHVDREELRRDISRLQRKYYGLPMSQIKLGVALAELLDLTSHYQVRIPSELSLVVKMLMTTESIISQLDPHLSIVDIAEPYGRRALRQRFSPARLKSSALAMALDYSRLMTSLPNELENMVGMINEGEVKVKMEHVNLQKITAKFDIMSNRLSLAIIVASLIMGTAMIADKMNSTIITRFPVVELGFISAMILGLMLAYSIIRSGKY